MVTAAREAKTALSVCGEMAASREGALLLVGLGYRELSMTPSSIRLVREVLSSSRSGEIESVVARAILAGSLDASSLTIALTGLRGDHDPSAAPAAR